jgi:group I intron endonuclease
MTIGIYCLEFEGTDKVYIGQSNNIEYRFGQHKYSLKNNTSSEKLMEAYNLYGIPKLKILLECTESTLDENENIAIDIFNSVLNGFNTYDESRGRRGHLGLRGTNNPCSKYSNEQILKVFNLLVDEQHLTASDIADITAVSVYTVRSIASLSNYKWLEEVYPYKYDILKSIKGIHNKGHKFSSKALGKINPNLISPTGEVFTNIDNIKEFAKQHNLQHTNLGAVLNGHRKSHKGWRVCQ